jgi:hypothetical protein
MKHKQKKQGCVDSNHYLPGEGLGHGTGCSAAGAEHTGAACTPPMLLATTHTVRSNRPSWNAVATEGSPAAVSCNTCERTIEGDDKLDHAGSGDSTGRGPLGVSIVVFGHTPATQGHDKPVITIGM